MPLISTEKADSTRRRKIVFCQVRRRSEREDIRFLSRHGDDDRWETSARNASVATAGHIDDRFKGTDDKG